MQSLMAVWCPLHESSRSGGVDWGMFCQSLDATSSCTEGAGGTGIEPACFGREERQKAVGTLLLPF